MAVAAFNVSHSGSLSWSSESSVSEIKTVAIRPALLVLFPKDSNQPYTLLRQVGSGGQAIVWEVVIPGDETHYALKINRVGRKCLTQFLKEAHALKACQGIPHVLPYRGDFDLAPACNREVHNEQHPDLCIGHKKGDEQRHAILTDLLPCRNMFHMFMQSRSAGGSAEALSSSQLLNIAGQALETLRGLQLRGYLHGDLKPENMIWNPFSGELTICDYGFAQRIDQIDPARTIGTRCFRAPELILSKRYTESVDVWSLGVCLYELYTRSQFIPTEGRDGDLQPTIDYLHILYLQMGKPLSPAFIDEAPYVYHQLFTRDGSYKIAYSPSPKTKEYIKKYRKIARDHPGVPLWHVQIRIVAELKGELLSDADRIIAFIDPMLRYEGRITVLEALQRLKESGSALQSKTSEEKH